MIDHVSFYATDFARSLAFHEATLGALGYGKLMDFEASWNAQWPTQRMAGFGPPGDHPAFWLIETRTAATGRHLAFRAPGRAAVDAFHRGGLAAGGRDNGPPGVREAYAPDYYAAFVIDPDGNNVEAVTRQK